jgi:AhpD family alkylhydroperoxidase
MSNDNTAESPRDPFELNDAEFAATFDHLYAAAWGDGAIPAKYKELAGVSISIVTRCEACLAYHLRMAHAQNASKDEFVEAIRLGVLAGGSITIPTARRGYEALHDLGVL